MDYALEVDKQLRELAAYADAQLNHGIPGLEESEVYRPAVPPPDSSGFFNIHGIICQVAHSCGIFICRPATVVFSFGGKV